MFQLRFFGGFAKQRREFLAATELAPAVLHPEVEKQLEALATGNAPFQLKINTRLDLFLASLRAVRGLILQSALWNAICALVILCAVLASREVVRESTSFQLAVVLSLVYLVARGIQAAIDYFDWLRRAQVNRGVQVFLFGIVNRKVANLDPSCSAEFSSGQLKTLIGSDVEAVEDFISAAISQWVPTTVMLVFLGPAIYFLSGFLGLFALGLGLLAIPIAIQGGRWIERYQSRAQAKQDKLTTIVGEWVRNIRLVRYLGWEHAFEDQIYKQMRSFTFEYAMRHTIACMIYGITWSWWMVPVLGMFALSEFTGRSIGLVELFSTIWLLDHLMHYIQHIPYSLTLYGAASAGADRILRLEKAPELTRGLKPAPNDGAAYGQAVRLHINNLSFDYPNHQTLQNITTSLDLRQRIAIVGSVGSGKSTLLEILIGERIPTKGSIEVEFDSGLRGDLWRKDIYDLFRSQIAFSPQQPFLSNSLMRLNVDLGEVHDRAAIQAAAEKAQLIPDLALLPRGYEEEVGEIGINLSGGQKQRVSLARAFLAQRPIFVLDDPLSAVDGATEAQLMDALCRSAQGMLLVSHRLQELSRCHRVLVIDRGTIAEDGVPSELSKTHSSRYSAFLRALEEHGD